MTHPQHGPPQSSPGSLGPLHRLPVLAADAVRSAAELGLPLGCAGCDRPGQRLCAGCADSVAAALFPGGPAARAPDPCPPGLPPVTARGAYAGALGGLLAAYKDAGRRDLAPLLGALLREALTHAVVNDPVLCAKILAGQRIWVIPVPSSRASRRRRGDAPMEALGRVAVTGLLRDQIRFAPLLHPRRRVADQAGLSTTQRARNVEWSMQVPDGRVRVVEEVGCVVVDDVLTTGATLVEAARALRRAGAARVVAATVCATERRARRAPSAIGATDRVLPAVSR